MRTLSGEEKQVFKKAKKLSRGLYKNNFPELFPNKKDRLEIPITDIDYKNSQSFKLVDNYLKSNGYQINDYINGYAIKKGDKNIYKIGKLVKNNTYIANHFRDCIYRQKFKIVVSRHPYDIACASWNQDWDSCLNFEDGFNVESIHDMVIANSCMIAYLVSATKNTVLGRCFIIPYYNYDSGDYWLYTSNTAYGLFTKDMLHFLRKWLDENYNKKYIAPKLNTLDVIVKFKFPNDLVYDNDDIKTIKYFNAKYMNKYAIRKHLNENTLENILKECYKINGEYHQLDLVLEETKNWYEYHKSYGRNENLRDMKKKRFLLYWLEGKEPKEDESKEYFNYISRYNLMIDGSYMIQRLIDDEYVFCRYQLTKYLTLIKYQIVWDDAKEMIISWGKDGVITEDGAIQKRLLAKLA